MKTKLVLRLLLGLSITCGSYSAWAAPKEKADEEKVDVAKTKVALEKVKVTLSQAFEAALMATSNGKVIGVEIEGAKDGVQIDVDVLKDGTLVEVSIDGVTGKVLKAGPEKVEGKEAEEFEQAKKALPQIKVALADAVATAEKAVSGGKTFEVGMEVEDGKATIDVSILAEGKVFGVNIDGVTGKVLEVEKQGSEKKEEGAKKEKEGTQKK